MEKCEHGRNILFFCIYQHCSYKQAGGCDECLKKAHLHVGNASYIRIEEVNKLIEKFNIESSAKPKCRQFQELVFSFFTQIKTQFSQSLDIVSKSIVNRIGYPLLSNLNHLPAYKKIKHKQYKKLSAKQIKNFVNDCLDLDPGSIIRKERELYWDQIAFNYGVIEQVENLMKEYQKLVKKFLKNFKHDNSAFKKIDQLKKYLNSTIKINKNFNKKQKDADSKIVVSNLETSPSSDTNIKQNMISLKIEQKNQKKSVQKKNQMYIQSQKHKKYQLNNFKTNRKETQYFSVQKELKFNQQTYDQKEKEIYQRKQKLMKIMSSKEKLIEKSIQNSVGKTLDNSTGKDFNFFLQSPPRLNFQQNIKQSNKIFSKISIPRIQYKQSHTESHRVTSSKNYERSVSIKRHTSPRSSINHENSTISFKQELTSNDLRQQKNSEQSESDSKYKYGMGKLPIIESSSSSEEVLQQSQFCKTEKQKHFNIMAESSPALIKKSISEQRVSDEQKSACLYLKSLQMAQKQAIKYLKASLNYSAHNLSAAEYLSFLYLKQNKAKQCLGLCNQFLALLAKCQNNDLKISFINNKSASLNILGRYSESILLLEGQLLHVENAQMYKNLGDSYFFVGINQKCQYNYQKAIRLDGKLDEAMYNLAACLFSQGNYYGAQGWIKKALQINQKNEEYCILKKQVKKKLQKVAQQNLE